MEPFTRILSKLEINREGVHPKFALSKNAWDQIAKEPLSFEQFMEGYHSVMDASKEARFRALTQELAALLYEETAPEQVKTLAGIEEAIRGHLLNRVGPELGDFLLKQAAVQHVDENGVFKVSSDH